MAMVNPLPFLPSTLHPEPQRNCGSRKVAMHHMLSTCAHVRTMDPGCTAISPRKPRPLGMCNKLFGHEWWHGGWMELARLMVYSATNQLTFARNCFCKRYVANKATKPLMNISLNLEPQPEISGNLGPKWWDSHEVPKTLLGTVSHPKISIAGPKPSIGGTKDC